MKISWEKHADTSRGELNREKQQQPDLVAEVSSLPSSQPQSTTSGQIIPASPINSTTISIVNNNSDNGQGEGTIPAQLMSQEISSTPLPGSLVNNDIAVADASLGQAAAGSLSQEAPSASLFHARVGYMSLSTAGNDMNNTTASQTTMDWYNFTESRCYIIRKLDQEAAYIQAKSGQLSPRSSTWCGVAVKKMSDEVKIVASIVSQEYATAPGSIRKIEMLDCLGGRLRELIEIMAKFKKILDMLNKGSIVVVVRVGQYSKKVKASHEKLKRIRAEIETTITRMKTSWGQHADTSREGVSREEKYLNLPAEVSNLSSSLPPTTTPTLGQTTPPTNSNNISTAIGDGQGEGTIPAQSMSQVRSSMPVPGALINYDIAAADVIPGQAAGAGNLSSPSMETSTAAQPISQEAPSASLSHTRVGTLSLNTVGNDVNNTTVHDHS
ncbi:hypothetical protein BT96DRAFT_992531 [Gymnopus androsaceus JB14]|uniref:Uncharacterized protein n=1 Tax=Gymnopus androsaceus JB14 TaxID=1447944 RepID=A0A6A4HVQ5_9AGAR|nr:hypothetical protein BT96DRAFT_992531 [Gymnopus androsaceus JB14]